MFLVYLNLTGYVQCILCVDSLVDILVHQSGTFFVIWLFDCCIDCIVFHLVCLSVYCVNKDYQYLCMAVNVTDDAHGISGAPQRKG